MSTVTTSSPSSPPEQFPCIQCGANLQFAPGSDSLVCPYCGTQNHIAAPVVRQVRLLEFKVFASGAANDRFHETLTVRCNACGAQATLPPDTAAGRCPFCSTPIVAETQSHKSIKPSALLPFEVNKAQATELFRNWIRSLWLAPSGLAKRAEAGHIDGVYIPAWLYFTDTRTQYTGERGDDYTTTETYTEYENGHAVTRTRQVVHTRWHSVSGVVGNHFDDLLVLASQTLPPHQATKLQPWDVNELKPYADEYLSGFIAQSEQVDLVLGFEQAKEVMQPTIRRTIDGDIGGDHQRIDTAVTNYFNTFFIHVLLPIWISAYQYQSKAYRFLVNGRTGRVQGERPWSVWKIVLLVVTILAAIIAGCLVYSSRTAQRTPNSPNWQNNPPVQVYPGGGVER